VEWDFADWILLGHISFVLHQHSVLSIRRRCDIVTFYCLAFFFGKKRVSTDCGNQSVMGLNRLAREENI
jgi:hypothetical protein